MQLVQGLVSVKKVYNIDYSVFTERQREVIELLMQGYSNFMIADRTFISVATVKFHLTKIYKIMGVKSRSEFVLKVNSLGGNNV